MTPEEVAEQAGVTLFDHQKEFLDAVPQIASPMRSCLYHRTGAGKSFTSLAAMKLLGMEDTCVIAPPSTHKQWEALASVLGMDILTLSHAKFRMKGTKLSRWMPVIADEMHLFGGHKGQGWRKLDTLALHSQAPMIIMSATPNYNDVERCYCVQHILDPHGTKGGYLAFLYANCNTEANPFSMEPKVLGFRNHPDAASYLSSLPKVYYLPDERVVPITDLPYSPHLPAELTTYSYNRRDHRMMASRIEQIHAARLQGLITEHGLLRLPVQDEVQKVLNYADHNVSGRSVLIYANHSTVARAISDTLHLVHVHHELVTGTTSKAAKEEAIANFIRKRTRILVGTATLATGTDGMDRVCNTLLIVDDTDDDALRQQLIGRILPRGEFTSLAGKEVFRLIPV